VEAPSSETEPVAAAVAEDEEAGCRLGEGPGREGSAGESQTPLAGGPALLLLRPPLGPHPVPVLGPLPVLPAPACASRPPLPAAETAAPGPPRPPAAWQLR
jgi:hypothetical protein